MANNALVGIAGVHHVVSELSRRGMVALPTVRNTAGYDVVVTDAAGTRFAVVQVKTSHRQNVLGWVMPRADGVRTGPRDLYVFVRWLHADARYECYLLTGRQARAEVERFAATRPPGRSEGWNRGTVSISPSNAKNRDKWRKAWDDWQSL